MNPWKVGAVIAPSDTLIDQFHLWDKTKSKDKRMRSFNRAKQWISKLLNRPFSVPNNHKMRQEDLQNALDHMVNAHAQGISHVEYLWSCLAPTSEQTSNDIITPVSNESATANDEEEFKDATANLDNQENETLVSKESTSSELHETVRSSPNVQDKVQESQSKLRSQPSTRRANLQPICKSVWLNKPCELENCTKAHPTRCKNPSCMDSDQGLPRWRQIQCKNWHGRPKKKKIRTKSASAFRGQPSSWPPLPPSRGHPISRPNNSYPKVTIPVWQNQGQDYNTSFSQYRSGNESAAAWSTPLPRGGNQMFGDKKMHLATELLRLMSLI